MHMSLFTQLNLSITKLKPPLFYCFSYYYEYVRFRIHSIIIR